MIRLLLMLPCLLLASCVAREELMLGGGNALTMPLGGKIPNNPAVIAAMSGNKVYRYRELHLGGDHITHTSSGSDYSDADAKSFADFLQMVGVSVMAWSQAAIAKAQEISTRYVAGQITKREAQSQMTALSQSQLAAKGGAYGQALEHGAVPTVGEVAPP